MKKIVGFSQVLLILLIMVGRAGAEASLTELVQSIQPAVVTISTFDMDNNSMGIGSGFFVDDKGHLVTNYHVLEGAFSAFAKTSDGNMYPIVRVITENKALDLIKVRVGGARPEALKWVQISERDPRIAERILVVGSPLGLEQTVSVGIVSAIRELPTLGKFFQLSAPISAGSSGSPVINMEGKVAGIVTFQSIKGQNINFAVSGHAVRAMTGQEVELSLPEWTYSTSIRKQELAEALCRKGFTFSIDGEDKKADLFYREATEREPGSVKAWDGLGHCYLGLEKPNEAIRAHKMVLSIDPDFARGYYNIGKVHSRQQDHEAAVAAYQEAVKADPDFIPAHYQLGVAYGQMGMFDASAEAYESVVRLSPEDSSAHFQLGIAYMKLDRMDDAITAFKEVVRIDPEYAPAYYNMGVVYGALSRVDDERNAYREAIRHKPDFAPAHYNMGLSFLAAGNKSEAFEEYKILMRIDRAIAERLFEVIYQ